MNPFSEVKELKNLVSREVGEKLKAFENSLKEIGEPRHIHTIREDLEGQTYPETDVLYVRRVLRVNGERVEGVFPQFESKFDTSLPKSLWNGSDMEQFKYCTERLKERIERDPEFAKQCTPRQLQQIREGAPRISGLTWHHSEIPGKMQLVNAETHEKCRHTGGRSIWGGGSGCR